MVLSSMSYQTLSCKFQPNSEAAFTVTTNSEITSFNVEVCIIT